MIESCGILDQRVFPDFPISSKSQRLTLQVFSLNVRFGSTKYEPTSSVRLLLLRVRENIFEKIIVSHPIKPTQSIRWAATTTTAATFALKHDSKMPSSVGMKEIPHLCRWVAFSVPERTDVSTCLNLTLREWLRNVSWRISPIYARSVWLCKTNIGFLRSIHSFNSQAKNLLHTCWM